MTHAQCWAHTRRKLFETRDVEPEKAARGLDFIGGLYAVEERIRALKLSAAGKLDYRLMHAKPCRLHQIDPYDYLVDVLQRVGQHPASRVQELTPRLWKQLFADNPLRSSLHTVSLQ